MRSKATGFWMRYGTPTVNGAPFVWSQSSWKWQKRRDVPDRLEHARAAAPAIAKCRRGVPVRSDERMRDDGLDARKQGLGAGDEMLQGRRL